MIANSEGLWLRCHVSPGMFPDERFVRYESPFGRDIALFVPATEVNDSTNGEGRVKVQVFERDGHSWAVMPSEYGEAIAVNHADLVSG
jgi:hypothetical protein